MGDVGAPSDRPRGGTGRVIELAAPGATVTVTGPGGVGKSRLVADVVTDLAGPVTTGHLAALPTDADPAAVADALGFESVDAAAIGLAEQGGVVVLDCCEHVLDAARAVLGSVRAAAPAVIVIASSRAPIGLAGEQIHVLGPLPAGPAVELFHERAAAAGAPTRRPDRRDRAVRAASTACPWPSSWRPPEPGRSARASCCASSISASTCCGAPTGAAIATTPCGQRSRSPPGCSTT